MFKYYFFLFLSANLTLFLSSGCDSEIMMPEEPTPVVVTPPALMPDITFSDGPYYAGCPVTVTLSSLAGATLNGQWSDGSTQNSSSPRTFESAGSYTLTLKASLEGRSEEQMRTITILEQPTFSEVFQKDGNYTRMHKMLPHPEGGFVSFGDYCSTPGPNNTCSAIGYQLHWFNADGTLRTTRSFSHPSISFIAKAFTIAADGNVVVAYENSTLRSNDIIKLCLSKWGETGDNIWRETLESTWHIHPRALLEKTDGSFVVGGYARRPSDGINRAGMYLFGADGSHQRNLPFGELNNASRIERLLQTGPNEVLGLMTFDGRMKVANSLNNSVADLNASGYTAAALLKLSGGATAAVTTNGSRVKITHRKASGEVISNRSVSTPDVFLYNAVLLSNGNILVTGKQNVSGVAYGYLAEVTLASELVWEKRRSRRHSLFRAVQPTDDCGMLAVGFTDPGGTDNSQNEAYYIKLKPKGEF